MASAARNRLFDDRSPWIDRFGLLLAVTVVGIIILSLVNLDRGADQAGTGLGALVVSAAVGGTFAICMRASGLRRRWLRLADALVIVTVASGVVAAAAPGLIDAEYSAGWASPVWVVLTLLMPLAVVRRILTHRTVRQATIVGAISAYLLIALTFTFLFLAVDTLQGRDFFGGPEPTTSFMYFSMTSITTLGFGDLTPATDLGRLMATSEAALGQIFLVTLVAALVGRFSAREKSD